MDDVVDVYSTKLFLFFLAFSRHESGCCLLCRGQNVSTRVRKERVRRGRRTCRERKEDVWNTLLRKCMLSI